jgi:hypothetical protein
VPFSPIFFAQISFGKRNFPPFFANNKAPFFAAFRSAKKSAIFAKNFAKNRLNPTHSPKLDHFSPHFAPRKVQFFAIFRFHEKSAIFAAFRSAKKSAIFREKNREKQARPNPGRSPAPLVVRRRCLIVAARLLPAALLVVRRT